MATQRRGILEAQVIERSTEPLLDIPRPLSYLDDGAELPTDRLELYFLLKKAIRHVTIIGYETIKSREGVRDACRILARCARRLAIIADALADDSPPKEPRP